MAIFLLWKCKEIILWKGKEIQQNGAERWPFVSPNLRRKLLYYTNLMCLSSVLFMHIGALYSAFICVRGLHFSAFHFKQIPDMQVHCQQIQLLK